MIEFKKCPLEYTGNWKSDASFTTLATDIFQKCKYNYTGKKAVSLYFKRGDL